MFIGHTIQEEINSLHDNSLWRLDVGISGSFPSMNNIQVLEVLGNGKQFNVINIFLFYLNLIKTLCYNASNLF